MITTIRMGLIAAGMGSITILLRRGEVGGLEKVPVTPRAVPGCFTRLFQRPGMPLPKQFFEGLTGRFKGLFLALMGWINRIIRGVEEPLPGHPLARPYCFHNPAGRQSVNVDAVIVYGIGKALAPGELLAGEAVGIDFISCPQSVHGTNKERIPA